MKYCPIIKEECKGEECAFCQKEIYKDKRYHYYCLGAVYDWKVLIHTEEIKK